jgi:hypothetical protein
MYCLLQQKLNKHLLLRVGQFQHAHTRKTLGILYDQIQLVDFIPQWENMFENRILETLHVGDMLLTEPFTRCKNAQSQF